MLDSAQLARFERDGFVAIPDFVPADRCENLRTQAQQLVNGFDPDAEGVASIFTTEEQDRTADEYFLTSGDQTRFFFEPDAFLANGALRQAKDLSINKIAHAMHDLDPVFEAFSYTRELSSVVADLGFVDPRIIQSMYIFKQPNIGGEVTCHTDHTFLWTTPRSVTGFWFAIEDATIANGAMEALPGGHRLDVRQRFRRDGKGGVTFDNLTDEPYPTEGMVTLEAAQGTLIILDGALPHRSPANTSAESRHAYTLHVIEGGADYPADNWLQRDAGLPLRPLVAR